MKVVKGNRFVTRWVCTCVLGILLGGHVLAEAEAPYVGAKEADEGYETLSAEDMEMLRGKKILFASRSFGLNMRKGLVALGKDRPEMEFLNSYQRFDVPKSGGDLSIIPADIFEEVNFVHFLATYWPHTKRVEELDTLIRSAPHHFSEKIDVAMIYYHTAQPALFEKYSEKMDALRRDFPHITFIYVTSGFMAESQAKANEGSAAFGELMRKEYKGKVPLYDLGMILNNDGVCGNQYCPDYSKDPAGVHPNLTFAEQRMAKGFLVILRDALKNAPAKSDVKIASAASMNHAAGVEAPEVLPFRDQRVVRAILDHNGLTKKRVAGSSVIENGRIVELYLQECGIKDLPPFIGELTALRKLHLYGDPELGYPLLMRVPPELARCTKLEELLLNQNVLTSLPDSLVNLKNLKILSLGENKLASLPQPLKNWADQVDPDWAESQKVDD
ncbi:leucine-rich repeat domain-containing protein [Kiritimatiellaeota bacterium B1221]|nr:leucine-rich repeat domain-containing protein [Kiritimatiellaeota bacterium B1221]